MTARDFLKWPWRILAAVGAGLLALFTLRAWKDSQSRASGKREAEQEAERAKAAQLKADLEALRAKQNERLAREQRREEAEAEARRKADADTAPPPTVGPDVEDVIRKAREAVKEREQ